MTWLYFLERTVETLWQMARELREENADLQDEVADLKEQLDEASTPRMFDEPAPDAPQSAPEQVAMAGAAATADLGASPFIRRFRIGPEHSIIVAVTRDLTSDLTEAATPLALYQFLRPYLGDAFKARLREYGVRAAL